MIQITECKVVMGINKIELEEKVESFINEGWITSGDVVYFPKSKKKEVGLVSTEIECFQAMVKLKIYNL